MPRRSILSAAERAEIYAPPDSVLEMTTRYEFNAQDFTLIRSHLGAQNRLDFAVQLAYMRFPGVMLAIDEEPAVTVLEMVAAQLNIGPEVWAEYGARAETRREHLLEMQQLYGYRPFTTRRTGRGQPGTRCPGGRVDRERRQFPRPVDHACGFRPDWRSCGGRARDRGRQCHRRTGPAQGTRGGRRGDACHRSARRRDRGDAERLGSKRVRTSPASPNCQRDHEQDGPRCRHH